MNIAVPFQRFSKTMRCSIYEFKNAQLLHFHILTQQIPIWKVPEPFLE